MTKRQTRLDSGMFLHFHYTYHILLISMKQKLSFESYDIIPRVDKLIYKKNQCV